MSRGPSRPIITNNQAYMNCSATPISRYTVWTIEKSGEKLHLPIQIHTAVKNLSMLRNKR